MYVSFEKQLKEFQDDNTSSGREFISKVFSPHAGGCRTLFIKFSDFA
jgi:hypothetical protein